MHFINHTLYPAKTVSQSQTIAILRVSSILKVSSIQGVALMATAILVSLRSSDSRFSFVKGMGEHSRVA